MKGNVDWASLLASEAQIEQLVRPDEISKKYKLAYSSVLIALKRQEKRGLVEHVFENIYLNKLAVGASPKDLVNIIRPHAYISLDSALLEWGISSQSPIALTCVTTHRPLTVRTPSIAIEFRRIKKDLFWGFVDRKSRYGNYKIAEPEKALLDWVYYKLKDGFPLHLDEFQFQFIDVPHLLEQGKKFPRSVLDAIFPTLVEKCLPTKPKLPLEGLAVRRSS